MSWAPWLGRSAIQKLAGGADQHQVGQQVLRDGQDDRVAAGAVRGAGALFVPEAEVSGGLATPVS